MKDFSDIDYTLFDRPEILACLFHPRPETVRSVSKQAEDMLIPVEEGFFIGARFHHTDKNAPVILYFHGNGETVSSHDWIAPFYSQRGINLFVADYRGYGSSNGKPTISNMISDAHTIFKGFKKIIRKESFRNSLFVMGRSLGSMPAIELAFNYQDEVRGLIVESGTANNFRHLWGYLGVIEREDILSEESSFLNKVKIRQVHKPTLIIHGEYDQIISVKEGKELYQSSGAQDKRILIIPGADHNDVMVVKQSLYFNTIEEFVKAHA